MNSHDELQRLREENDELTERNRQLTNALRPDRAHAFRDLHLAPQQMLLLSALLRSRIVHAEQLQLRLDLDLATKYGTHSNATLRVLIHRLRKTLRPTGATVDTQWGVGYSMTPASKALVNARRVA